MSTDGERRVAVDSAADVVEAPRRTINPLFPICCIGILLALIAATIVLALVPIYLATRNVDRATTKSSQFTLGMELRSGVLPVGAMSADNCAAIQTKLREQAASNDQVSPSVPTVTSCTVTGNVTSTKRKKRQTIQGNQVDVVVVLTAGRCTTKQCSLRRGQTFVARLLALAPFTLNFIESSGSRADFVVAIIRSSAVTLVSSSTTNPDQVFYALTSQNQLLRINTLNPSIALSSVTISGLTQGDSIGNIDFRPATGQLYGASNRQLYVINEDTGVARSIGSALNSATYGSISSIEFNPVLDVLRVITSSSFNLRLDPATGAIISVDSTGTNDAGAGGAFSNNLAGASSSILYFVVPSTDLLTMQNTSGSLTSVQVGSGLGMDITSTCGFDISFKGVALACVNISNTLVLYLVDVTSGTLSQNLGQTSQVIMSLSMPTAPVAYAIQSSDNRLLIINSIDSQLSFTSKNVAGLASGETIVGLDMRPVNGQLYGLGTTSRLYTINIGTGTAVAIGTGAAFTPALSGTTFGFDFNPTVDRIRVVSNTGQNLRLNPNTGGLAAQDTNLNPSSPVITAAAYTNNVANATTTVLYDIDSNSDRLRIQNPPNNGALVDVGPLGVDVDSSNGFDIGGKTGVAIAVLTVNGVTGVYQINLSTGAATIVPSSTFPTAVRAYALGLGV